MSARQTERRTPSSGDAQGAALLFALRLTWIEWKVLGVWCIYCRAVFVLSLLAVIAAQTANGANDLPRVDAKENVS